MRVLLDEDVPVQALEPLRRILRGHTVDHVDSVRWKSKKDKFLFADAAQQGYDLLVTKNTGQLNDPDELAALKKAGIHHVTYEQGDGLDGLGRALGAIFAAMPGVVRELDVAPGQQLVTIRSVTRARHVSRDPAVDPPTYWPR